MACELGLNPRKLGKIDIIGRSRGRRRCLSSSSTFTSRGSAGKGTAKRVAEPDRTADAVGVAWGGRRSVIAA